MIESLVIRQDRPMARHPALGVGRPPTIPPRGIDAVLKRRGLGGQDRLGPTPNGDAASNDLSTADRIGRVGITKISDDVARPNRTCCRVSGGPCTSKRTVRPTSRSGDPQDGGSGPLLSVGGLSINPITTAREFSVATVDVDQCPLRM